MEQFNVEFSGTEVNTGFIAGNSSFLSGCARFFKIETDARLKMGNPKRKMIWRNLMIINHRGVRMSGASVFKI